MVFDMPNRYPEFRRYLTDIDSTSTQQIFTDVLVIGSGIAGLRAALQAAENDVTVTLLCKSKLQDSNTWQAQGGIASVLADNDSFESHINDTIKAGCGLCDPKVVSEIIHQGPSLLKELLEWGTEFDMKGDSIDITLEGGHSHARVAHAHGDSTGRGICEALIKKIKKNPSINVIENFFAIDIITDESGHSKAVIGYNPRFGMEIIWSQATILATGGAGRLFRETTNPQIATADGLAMAYRAGAVLRDMELMQFHPTTLYIAGASRALMTETLRGEGGILLDCNGYRFMPDYHPDAELAPRDVVSRAILSQMLQTSSTHVFLDVRHLDHDKFFSRFPLITELCKSFDIFPDKDLIPVRPSAHYMIGGVKVDDTSATSVPGLFAAGEVTSTGLHGGNRLGSNSLLEGLVYGKIAGQNAAALVKTSGNSMPHKRMNYQTPISDRSKLDTSDVRNSLRALMWRNVGITRRETHLKEAQEIIRFWHRYVMDKAFDTVDGWECQNMLTVALLMTEAAEKRKESRGVHYRQDFPDTNAQYANHTEQCSK